MCSSRIELHENWPGLASSVGINSCCKRGYLMRSRERNLNDRCREFKTRLASLPPKNSYRLTFRGIRCLWIDRSVPLLISMLDRKSAQSFQKYLNQTIIFFLVRYSLKVMEAGTDKALLDQKMYFANGGVYSIVIQPNPSKKDKVRI